MQVQRVRQAALAVYGEHINTIIHTCIYTFYCLDVLVWMYLLQVINALSNGAYSSDSSGASQATLAACGTAQAHTPRETSSCNHINDTLVMNSVHIWSRATSPTAWVAPLWFQMTSAGGMEWALDKKYVVPSLTFITKLSAVAQQSEAAAVTD